MNQIKNDSKINKARFNYSDKDGNELTKLQYGLYSRMILTAYNSQKQLDINEISQKASYIVRNFDLKTDYRKKFSTSIGQYGELKINKKSSIKTKAILEELALIG